MPRIKIVTVAPAGLLAWPQVMADWDLEGMSDAELEKFAAELEKKHGR